MDPPLQFMNFLLSRKKKEMNLLYSCTCTNYLCYVD